MALNLLSEKHKPGQNKGQAIQNIFEAKKARLKNFEIILLLVLISLFFCLKF
jgi:hypothetical protein